MFGKNKDDNYEKNLDGLLRQMEASVRLFEMTTGYLYATAKQGTISTELLVLLDYTTLHLLNLYGAPKYIIEEMKTKMETEHREMINGKKQPTIDNVEKTKEDLKKLGINFNLKYDIPQENKDKVCDDGEKEIKTNIQIPSLNDLQIRLIIEQNYDKVIDLYLKKKKEEDEVK